MDPQPHRRLLTDAGVPSHESTEEAAAGPGDAEAPAFAGGEGPGVAGVALHQRLRLLRR